MHRVQNEYTQRYKTLTLRLRVSPAVFDVERLHDFLLLRSDN